MKAIDIERNDDAKAPMDKQWRASVKLPPYLKLPYPVQGQMTKEGPWAEGWGYSPEAAIQNALAAVGRSVLSLLEPPPKPPQEGPEQDTK